MNASMRLKAPMGLLIDRDTRINFSFEGQQYQGYAGDTLASALAANHCWILSRSFKYHRPRGPLTMAGQDANTLVQLDREPNILADRAPLVEGMKVLGQNCNDSLEKDSDAVLDHAGRLMPVGFYYRAFFKPMGAWKFWEPLIRRKAGLGVLDLVAEHDCDGKGYDKAYLFHDLVVVGSGPAGLTAALTAADGGAQVLLVEEHPILGGSLTYHRFDLEGTKADALRASLVRQAEDHPRIRVLTDATCNGWFADNYLPVLQGKRMFKVRTRECIVASGSFEQHVVFRNNDLPGVMLSSAATRLMKLYAVSPGQRAVVLTGNDDGYLTALELSERGVMVSAVVDMRPSAQERQLAAAVAARGIDILSGHTVYEAHGSKGNRHLRSVDVRAITGRGKVADRGRNLDCDLLCMSAGYMPVYQLLCQAGGTLGYDDATAEFSITRLPPHLQVAGSVNGIHDLQAVLADGERAARQALSALGLGDLPSPEVRCDRKVNFEWPIFRHPKGREFVDYDEDLQAKDIVNATRLGYRDIQLVKRFSTVGMGPSQGRHSALPTARLVADATGRSVTETGITTARPPFAPEKLAQLAGRSFTPYRRTAMHHRHLELGAQMMPAGNWQRPAYYGPPADRSACVQAEVRHVRNRVGLIDVSTLGGIELRGPDAAEFMNRLYTFGFVKQPVGRTRYAVMTDEQGVVVDDGVACRIGDEHFYVTATTGGVERVYRQMTKWNAQWRLDVDIANVTSAFTAVNLAGPDSRKVLELLATDLDLSPAGFPYLAYREGRVADIPARLLRVGFVGELGYEIHVPARFGEALWDALLVAGKPFDLRPFGIEAQRLLRLEKGHIIVSQDTDGMSHPGELSLDWAVSRQKPFFVGGRSLKILSAQPQTRKLVGFRLPRHAGKPEEGHLVLQGDKIAGNVTSCEYSPTLDATIGLAFAGIEQSLTGSRLTIRIDGGEVVEADVVELPFFDKDGKRQEM